MTAATNVHVPLDAYDLGGTPQTRPITGGLINLTYRVDSPRGRFVLQRVNPIFAPEVHEDIEAVTAHLAGKGLPTTRLVRTRSNELCTRAPDGTWRLLTFVEGTSFHRVESAGQAESAGELVGRFHQALADLRHDFRFRRAGVHDTAKHFSLLDAAIDAHAEHPEQPSIAKLRDELRTALAALPALASATAPRITHGDLKISNVLFEGGKATTLVDLDTVGEMPLPYELGDAWRSWCNPLGEDDEAAVFEPALLQAAWRGYAGPMGEVLTPEERALIVPGILTVCLELSARFARDVLEDKYFGWDTSRFGSRGEHNLVRARSQAAEYRSLLAQRSKLDLSS